MLILILFILLIISFILIIYFNNKLKMINSGGDNIQPILYFPKIIGNRKILNEKLMSTSVSGFSSTPDTFRHKFNLELEKNYGSLEGKTVIDACACIGSDSIKFIMLGANVISIELEYENYKALVNNLDYLDIENKHTTIKGNCLQYLFDKNFIDQNKPNIIYFDPPWSLGNNKYNRDSHSNPLNLIDLNGDLISIENIIMKLINNVELIIIKSPHNYQIFHSKKLNIKSYPFEKKNKHTGHTIISFKLHFIKKI